MNAIQYARSVAPDRRAWRDSMPQRCMRCYHRPAFRPLHVHEIERRSHAPRTWGNHANYLLVCEDCHQGPLDSMEHAKQLAIKLVADPEHFDLAAWLRIGDPELRAPDRVTWTDIAAYLAMKGAA